MMGRLRSAFTLVEILVVLACSLLLLTPAWRIFRYGTQASLRGMTQIDTTLEGRRIIKQVHNDLKASCFLWDDKNKKGWHMYSIEDVLAVSGATPLKTFSFYRFPHHGEILTDPQSNVSFTEKAPRAVHGITYKLEAEKSGEPLQLIRIEETSNGISKKILSKRVNFFDIQSREIQDPRPTGKNQWIFWITLQLREGSPKALTSPALIRNLGAGVTIVDFYDVTYSEFFNAFSRYAGLTKNWHTGLQEP